MKKKKQIENIIYNILPCLIWVVGFHFQQKKHSVHSDASTKIKTNIQSGRRGVERENRAEKCHSHKKRWIEIIITNVNVNVKSEKANSTHRHTDTDTCSNTKIPTNRAASPEPFMIELICAHTFRFHIFIFIIIGYKKESLNCKINDRLAISLSLSFYLVCIKSREWQDKIHMHTDTLNHVPKKRKPI